MPEWPPEHPWTMTPILTSYWLPPWPSVHSVIGQFVQSLLETAYNGPQGQGRLESQCKFVVVCTQ